MSKLTDFLLENPINDLTEQVTLSARLKDHPFTIRAMTGEEFSDYQRQASRIIKGKNVEFDSRRFQEAVILNHTLEPDFKNAELLKKAGCMTPAQFMYKVLLAGEIAELVQKISALSGFDQSMDDMVAEAKNS